MVWFTNPLAMCVRSALINNIDILVLIIFRDMFVYITPKESVMILY